MNLKKQFLTKNDCYKAGKSLRPKGVMVHSTGANNPNLKRYIQPNDGVLGVNVNNNDWNRPGIQKCVHAFIGKTADGSIATYQTLPWHMRGWHCGTGTSGTSANNTHISFEICEDALNDRNYFNLVYREAVELTAYLCKMYNLNPLADGVVICHSEGYRRGIASGHSDVEHWFPKFGKTMDNFRADAAAEMEGDNVTQEQFEAMYSAMIKKKEDNDAGSWSATARAWAVENGIFAGGGNANYMWERPMTREELATTLYRFAQLMGKV